MKSVKPKTKSIVSSNSSKPLGSHIVGIQLPDPPKIRIPLSNSQLLLICNFPSNIYTYFLCLINTQTLKPSLQFSLKCPFSIFQYLLLPNMDLLTVGYDHIVHYEYKKNYYSIKLIKFLPIIDYYLKDNKYYKKVNNFLLDQKYIPHLETIHGKMALLSNNRIAIGGGSHIETILIYKIDSLELIKILEFNNQTITLDERFPGDCMYTSYYVDPHIYSINQLFQPKNKEVLFAFTCIGRLLVFDLEKYSLIKEEKISEKTINEICYNQSNNLLLALNDEKCFMINIMDGPNYSLVKTIDINGNYKFHQLENGNQVILYEETSFVLFNTKDLQIDSKNTIKKSDKKYVFFEFAEGGKIYIGTEKLNIYEFNPETLEMKIFGKPRYPYTFIFKRFLVYEFEKTIRFYVFK